MRLSIQDVRELLRDYSFRIKVGVLAVAGVVVVLSASAGALTLTSQVFFCRICHEMKADYAAWKTSSHAEVACVACHIEPGLVKFVRHKMGGLKEVYYHLTNSYKKPINAESELAHELPPENCNVCHAIDYRKVTPSRGIKINHEVHEKEKMNCATCHNRVAHPAMRGYENFLSMEGCNRCHGFGKTARAPGRCDLCHTRDFELRPATHKVAVWLPPKHSQEAKRDKKACMACHEEEKFCQKCHGVPMPHSTAFKKAREHSDIGSKRPDICRRCHTSTTFCNDCHHEGSVARIPWRVRHAVVVRQGGAGASRDCFKCHDPRYCDYCHVRGVPNPAYR